MSNRTWACVDCGKTYRRDQNITYTVACAICGNECEYVHWKIHVPSPKKVKEWKQFWTLYRKEKQLLEQWQQDQTIDAIKLDILNMKLWPRKKRLP